MPDPTILSIAAQVTTTIPISTYLDLFVPVTPGPGAPGIWYTPVTPTIIGTFPTSYTFSFMGIMTNSAPLAPLVVSTFIESVMEYYLGIRIAFTMILFVIGFVMRRIGLTQGTTTSIAGLTRYTLRGGGRGRRLAMVLIPALLSLALARPALACDGICASTAYTLSTPGGGLVTIEPTYTFGDIVIAGSLLALLMVQAITLLYSIVYSAWDQKRRITVMESSADT